jgi:hypothetical protein
MSKIRLFALILAATFTAAAFAEPVIEPGFLHVFRRPGGVGEECFQAFRTASGDPAEEEIDPDPVVLLPDDNACRFASSDDHGDVRSCATPLEIGTPLRGTSVHGELANGWGDDEDTFVFVVGPAEWLSQCRCGVGERSASAVGDGPWETEIFRSSLPRRTGDDGHAFTRG